MSGQDDNLRVPPYNIEAEQSIIGSLLIDRDAVYRVIEIVDPEDFYRDEHKYIIRAIYDLASEEKPIDIVSVADKLKSSGKLEFVGGITYLARLADSVPNSANADYYAKIVKDKSLLRQLIKAGGDISELGFDQTSDIDTLIDRAERKIFSLSQKRMKSYFVQIKDFLPQSFSEMESRYKRKSGISGIPSSFISILKSSKSSTPLMKSHLTVLIALLIGSFVTDIIVSAFFKIALPR